MELEDKKEILENENKIVDNEKTSQEEEKRKQKIFEIEKKLGRHNNEKELKNKKNSKLMKYFALATNMVYARLLFTFKKISVQNGSATCPNRFLDNRSNFWLLVTYKAGK